MADEGEDDEGGGSGDEGDGSVEAKVEAMQRELTSLRRTTVAGLGELKLALAELSARLPPPPAAAAAAK